MSTNQLPNVSRSGTAVKVSKIGSAVVLAAATVWGASRVSAAGDAEPGASRDPQVVTVITRDYSFESPDTLVAGATTFRLLNQGTDFHHVWLVRLDSGKTAADLMKAMGGAHNGPMPKWAVDAGGPNSPAPGGESNATLTLSAGNYVMICVIPAKDGQLHLMKGMFKPIVVLPTKKPAAMPKADVTMTLDDYTFEFSTPLRAGRRTIRIVNNASQTHEAFIAKLEPGKQAGDVLAWMAKPDGPPPALPLGGIAGIAKGAENQVTLDLTPGEYALYCFVPDAKDGKPHIAHGMVKQFTVR